jgi:hypothetical protein
MRQTQTQAQAELVVAAAVLRPGWDAEAEEGDEEDGSFHGGLINGLRFAKVVFFCTKVH